MVSAVVHRPVWKWLVLLFVADFFMLMWVGAMPAEGIYVVLGRLGTAYWFGFIFILAPIVGLFETRRYFCLFMKVWRRKVNKEIEKKLDKLIHKVEKLQLTIKNLMLN